MSDLPESSKRREQPGQPERSDHLYPDPDLTPAPGTGRAWSVPDRDPHSPAVLRSRRGPDLRLVPVALTVWLSVILTVVTRTPWPPLFTGMPVLVGGLVVGVRRWGPRGHYRPGFTGTHAAALRTGVLAGLCAAVWSARAALLVHRADRHPWLTGTSRRFSGVLELAGAPKRLTGGSLQAPVDVPDLGTVPLFISPDEIPADTPAGTDPLDAILDLQPGAELAVTATVLASDRPGIAPVTLSAVTTSEPADGPDGISAVTAHLRDGLRDAASHLPDGASDLVPGMVVGDVGGQAPATRTEFLATGLSHLTAVSGANTELLGVSLCIRAGTGQRVVQCRTPHAHVACDLGFRYTGSDTLPGLTDLIRGHPDPSLVHALPFRDSDALGLTLPDRRPLQLSHGSEDREHEPALWTVSVQRRVIDELDTDTPVLHVSDQCKQVRRRPGEPVRTLHPDRVTFSHIRQHRLELWTVRCTLPGELLGEELVHLSQCLDLTVKVLILGRDAGVADDLTALLFTHV